MNKYQNAACPVCEKTFRENEDIVVCPECGAPHHRTCYQQLGHCALEHLHENGFIWEAPAPEEPQKKSDPHSHGPDHEGSQEHSDRGGNTQGSVIPCPRCGKPNPEEGLFCSSCGWRLHQNADSPSSNPFSSASFGAGAYGAAQDPYAGLSPDDELDGVKVKDLSYFIGNNSAYFMNHFVRMKRAGRPISVNFSSLFFGWQYFLYRKMYGWAILLYALHFLLGLPSAICLVQDFAVAYGALSDYSSWFNVMLMVAQFAGIASSLLSLATGLFCNKLYYCHCIKKIKKVGSRQYVSEHEFRTVLAKKGRTNLFIIAFLMMLYVGFTMMLMPFLMV